MKSILKFNNSAAAVDHNTCAIWFSIMKFMKFYLFSVSACYIENVPAFFMCVGVFKCNKNQLYDFYQPLWYARNVNKAKVHLKSLIYLPGSDKVLVNPHRYCYTYNYELFRKAIIHSIVVCYTHFHATFCPLPNKYLLFM